MMTDLMNGAFDSVPGSRPASPADGQKREEATQPLLLQAAFLLESLGHLICFGFVG